MITISLIIAILLAIIHLFAGQLRFLNVIPRSRWLSIAGGSSVAYVFLHIFPDLSQAQLTVQLTGGLGLKSFENHVYLASLLGLSVFYGLERAAKKSRQQNKEDLSTDATSPQVFWLHIGSFAFYNALIGYLLRHREVPGLRSLILFGLAMGLHFIVNDYGLREDHKQAYHQIGRWILSVSVLIGWLIGLMVAIHPGVVAILFGFLAGGVILNTLKEELPAERESRFGAFVLGALIYGIIISIH
jgi:hypothetical protein